MLTPTVSTVQILAYLRHVRKIDRADDADAAYAADAMPDVTVTIDAPSIVYIIYANCDHDAAPLSVFSERGLFGRLLSPPR